MGRYRKIVWNEGMLLTPHHFQQSDNFHEELLNSRIASLVAYEWGILDLQVNREGHPSLLRQELYGVCT